MASAGCNTSLLGELYYACESVGVIWSWKMSAYFRQLIWRWWLYRWSILHQYLWNCWFCVFRDQEGRWVLVPFDHLKCPRALRFCWMLSWMLFTTPRILPTKRRVWGIMPKHCGTDLRRDGEDIYQEASFILKAAAANMLSSKIKWWRRVIYFFLACLE